MSRLGRLARPALLLCCLSALTACRFHPETRLGQAAFSGDLPAVQSLVTRTPPDAPDGPFTPLMLAARAGHVAVLNALLDAGADVNRRDADNGWTPLMHALHKRRHQAAQLLLARGADAGTGPGGISALEMAALDNDAAMIRLLLPAGATSPQITRAFALAVSGGALADIDRPLLGGCHGEAVRALLDARAPDLRIRLSELALWWAELKGCHEVVGLVRVAGSAASR